MSTGGVDAGKPKIINKYCFLSISYLFLSAFFECHVYIPKDGLLLFCLLG
jgi:hypothetical protein